MPVGNADAVSEGAIFVADGFERVAVIVDQVHFRDCKHEVANSDQVGEVGVAPGLREHALAGIHQQHGDIRGRSAGHHIARILLVPGRIGDDELALLAGEEAVGDVDGDSLLALRRKAIHQKREIEVSTVRPGALAVGFQRLELVVEDLAAIVEQAPDQRRFAIVDASAGDEAQHLLLLVASEPPGDVGCDQRPFLLKQARH